MVYLIFAYLVPLLLIIIHLFILTIRRNKVVVKLISPFYFFMGIFTGITMVIGINVLHAFNLVVLISLICVYIIFSVYSLFNAVYLCEKKLICGLKRIELSLISFEISGCKVNIYVYQELFLSVYVNKNNVNKLNEFVKSCNSYIN